MKRYSATLLVLLITLSVGMVNAQPVDTPADTAQGNETREGGPPGFVSGIVGSVTPDFLGNLFKDLPVPGFVKGLFGAG